MDNKNFEIKLKNNPNIVFEVALEFCTCGRVMFLKKNSQDGSVFWSCKGYHQDQNVKLCDLTRDVKCFRCHTGELRRKQNQETGQFFYGCSNYSTVSVSGCNFTLEENEIDDVIEQVNDALKFKFDFRSTQFDSIDEKKWEEQLKNSEADKTNEVNTSPVATVLTDSNVDAPVLDSKEEPDDSKKFNLPIPPKLAAYIASGVLILGLFAILNGSGVKIDLFQGMFKIEVTPNEVTAENIDVKMDGEKEEVQVKNTSDEAVDISELAILNESGAPLVNFESLPEEKKILEPGESLNLDSKDLLSMASSMENNLAPSETPGSTENSSELSSPKPASPVFSEYSDSADQMIQSLFKDQEKITIAREIVEEGQQIYSKLKEVSVTGKEMRENFRKLGKVDSFENAENTTQDTPIDHLEEFNRFELEQR